MNATPRRPTPRLPLVAVVFAAALAMPAAATATAPAPATPPAAGAADPAEPAAVEFDALPDHIGARVRVSTRIKTVREGELTGASPTVINVRLDKEAGGYLLAMPRETVESVEIVAPAPAKH